MPAVKPLVDDAAFVDGGTVTGRRREDKLGVREKTGEGWYSRRSWDCRPHSADGNWGTQESWSEIGRTRTAAVKKNKRVFMSGERRDNQRVRKGALESHDHGLSLKYLELPPLMCFS